MYSVILKKITEQAYSAEKATKARSESTLRNFSVQYSAVLRSRLQRDSLVLK
jgi:hypothetical protein